MNTLEQCASISEMIFQATQAADQEVKQPEPIQFDVSPLIDLALDTRDEEWFCDLTAKNKIVK